MMNRKVLFWPFLRPFGSKTKVERAAVLLTACEKGLDEGVADVALCVFHCLWLFRGL